MEETKKDVEVVDEKKEEVVDEKAKEVETSKGDEKKAESDSTNVPQADESKKEEATEQGVVETVDNVGNGLSIDDLVTKEDLKASLDALNAKFDALMKELADKDAKLKEIEDKAHGLEDKFVNNGDFGTEVSRSGDAKADAGYESFDAYSARFRN